MQGKHRVKQGINTNIRTVAIFERGRNEIGLQFIFIIGSKGYQKGFKAEQERSYQYSTQTCCESGKKGLIRSSEW